MSKDAIKSRWGQSSHIQVRQPAVAKSRHQVAHEGNAEENQPDLVGLASKYADARFRLVDVDTGSKEQGSAEVDGKGDCDVSDDKSPATDPGHDPPIRRRG